MSLRDEEEIPIWWPKNPAIYDISKSYADNAQFGPFMHGQPIPKRIFAPKEEWKDFLGFKIASPLGVPAGPLLNSNWIGLAADLGFDVVNYKTIRSAAHAGHPVPNMIYVTVPPDLKTLTSQTIESIEIPPESMGDLAVTNSFGMPSKDREFLKLDIPRANSLLKEGQVMIVSVVGTPSESKSSVNPGDHYTNFVKDFVEVASFAKDCGAKIIEANFSCPNVVSGEGSIFQNADTTRDIASAIVQALGDTPLILKVGTYEDEELMKRVFRLAAEVKVSAICGINSVSMKVVSPKTKESALGANRLTSGVCGGPIRPIAVDFMKRARRIINNEQLNLALLGCGGITEPQHFDEFLDAGAQVVMSATGMMWDPYLAARWHATKTKI